MSNKDYEEKKKRRKRTQKIIIIIIVAIMAFSGVAVAIALGIR